VPLDGKETGLACLGVAILEVGLGTWEIHGIIQERQREAQKKA
jgi:hypothetical protein